MMRKRLLDSAAGRIRQIFREAVRSSASRETIAGRPLSTQGDGIAVNVFSRVFPSGRQGPLARANSSNLHPGSTFEAGLPIERLRPADHAGVHTVVPEPWRRWHEPQGLPFRFRHCIHTHSVVAAERSSAAPAAGLPSDWADQGPEVADEEWVQEQELATQAAKAQADYYIPVNSLYIARSLDLKGLLGGPLRNFRSHLVRNNVIVRFPDRTDGPAGPPSRSPGLDGVPSLSERYMVAFQYGSVVFLNFEGEEQEVVLEMLRPYCTDHFREARKDDYGVVLRPSLAGWSEGGQDHVLVRQLDINNIRVIGSVLGQSVALEFYAKKVDEMVNTFSELNRGMEQTGTFTMKRKKLFQLVAAANTTLADVILRLGLLERSDTAWKHAQYAKIWEYLRDDFELDERFESLDFKLNIIQHNVRFFLDILQNRKSDTLEWIIILLIAGEICVSLYEIISKALESSQGKEGGAPAAFSRPAADD